MQRPLASVKGLEEGIKDKELWQGSEGEVGKDATGVEGIKA